MGLVLVVPPAVEPVSVPEARQWLRLDHTEDDALVAALITAARQECELITGRQLMAATWDLYLDEWPGDVIRLPRPPLQSVEEVAYWAPGADEETIWPADNYRVDAVSEPGRLVPAEGVGWPPVADRINAIRIRYVAGYQVVPEPIRGWIRLRIGDLYEVRQSVMFDTRLRQPQSIARTSWYDGLLDNYRVWR